MSDIIRIPCGNVNAFLIKEGDSAVLVDTGLAGYAEKIYDVCKDSQVKCIILTHGHIDHIQNTAVLSKRLNVPIAIGIGDEDLVDDNTLQSMYGRGAIGKILGLPGHTKGSIGIDVEERDLIVGDSLMNMIKPSLSLIYENKMQLELSAREISDLGKRFIHFGHGKSVQNRKWV